MNTETTAIANNDNFSWRRVGAVAAYYYPALRMQIYLYPALSVAVGILSYFMLNSVLITLFGSVMSMALALMLYLAPIAFTRRSNMAIEVMLPATWQEKSTFIILYSVVAIPVLVLFPKWAVLELMQLIFGSNAITAINDITVNLPISYIYDFFTSIIPLVTCLYVVFRCKNNRAVLGAVFAIVPIIAMGIAGVIYGMIFAFSSGYFDAIAQNPNSIEDPGKLNEILSPLLWTVGIFGLLYTLTMLWLTSRKIRRIQI